MASDFGDEAGGELYDWMLRIGQDAGEQAVHDAAKRLADALRNMRSGVEHADELPPESVEKPRWAKLDMAEIDALPYAQCAPTFRPSSLRVMRSRCVPAHVVCLRLTRSDPANALQA